MMSADEMRKLCMELRYDKDKHTDDELVGRILSDVGDYRALLEKRPEQEPFAPLDELLPLMGWLIYETSWDSLQRIDTSFGKAGAKGAGREVSETAFRHIGDLADAARRLPWPEFAPRALGAIRAQALAWSKLDTEAGYDTAWITHEEARAKYHSFKDSHGTSASRERFVLALDEVLLQLALAETGTACRTAERVVTRWAEEFAIPGDPVKSRAEEERWVQRMFRELTAGLEVGELAMETADRIRRTYQLAERVDEFRLALRSAQQNPGIMSARAALLLLALAGEMKRLGRHPKDFPTWQSWEADMMERFKRAYRAIDRQVDENGDPVPMRAEFQRQLIQMRLNLALLKPGYDLPSMQSFHPCLAINPLDDTALTAMSKFIDTPGRPGRQRGIGAATMPSFIRSVTACRSLGADDRGYHQWRIEWFALDAHAKEDGRKERVMAALAASHIP